MARANIFNIQRFSVDDGPGIRTTVFFKGCPLSCIWCHNPESNKTVPQLMYIKTKCVSCGACVSVCPHGVHLLSKDTDGNAVHTLNRDRCTVCAECSDVCPTKALEICGRWEEIDAILDTADADRVFYETSGGGLTVSGGEPLAQPSALTALLKGAKERGLHTAVETCGYASEDSLRSVIPYTDLFLFDYKAEAETHERFTGVPLAPILHSLDILEKVGANVILRCPIIPMCNDTQSHFDAIAALAEQYSCIGEVQLEPYHPLGIAKHEQLGQAPSFDARDFLPKNALTAHAEEIATQSGKPCRVN